MEDDFVTAKLIALCARFGDTPSDGRYHVAKKAGLSEQYLYQIITKKPMSNGSLRSVGKIARVKLSEAFPDWLDSDPVARTAENAPEVTELPRQPLDEQLSAQAMRLMDRIKQHIGDKFVIACLDTVLDGADYARAKKSVSQPDDSPIQDDSLDSEIRHTDLPPHGVRISRRRDKKETERNAQEKS